MITTSTKSIIPKSWDVPLEFKRRVGSEVGRQRLMEHDGNLLLVLHQIPQLDDDGKRNPALFWKDPDGQWKSLTHGGGVRALQEHINQYDEAMDKLDSQLDRAQVAADYFDVLRTVKPLLRASRNLVAVLESLRKAMPEDYTIMGIRDQGIAIERAVDLIDSDARHGMNFCMAESAAAQARASLAASEDSKRLNRLVAFFCPLATLAAILGMNPPSEVLTSTPIWVIILFGFGIGWLMQRKKTPCSTDTYPPHQSINQRIEAKQHERKQPVKGFSQSGVKPSLRSRLQFPVKRKGPPPIPQNPIKRNSKW